MSDRTNAQPLGLYEALLQRRSVRRYAKEPLSSETLQEVQQLAQATKPLFEANRLRVMLRDVVSGEDLVAAMGSCGRMLSPPHFLLPALVGDRCPLVDLGYRMQQLVIRLTMRGIGSCYIGTLGRETDVRARFSLAPDIHIAAFLIFGQPATATGGRVINTVIRRAYGSTNRLPVEELFFQETFEQPSAPPKSLAKLIAAGQRTPSALNVQPWRFLWHKGSLYLFVKAENPRYGGERQQLYRSFDAGLCMANLTLALEALKMPGTWHLYEGKARDIPPYPAHLLPIARLQL